MPSLKREIRKVSERNDILLVEYPFWMPILSSIQNITPVVLTLHDILSESVTQPWLKDKVVQQELAACRSSAGIVCCNDSDAAFLKSHGFSAKVVPHGITIPKRGGSATETPEGKLFEVIDARRRAGAMICFFVGSSHQPNREALDAISLMALELREDSRFLFVSAGSCCALSIPSKNEVHLGSVSEEALDWLYSCSEIILAPLKSGTGASLKTIEALARKKVLLTTTVGARGYPLVSGRDALIVEQPKDFTRALLSLADQPEERVRLSAGGWEFVQQYDSDHVYKAYLRIISHLIASKRP
jgi:glycosyltransferase involved in cell wall biosynthesis